MTEMLMTEAETTNNGDASQTPADASTENTQASLEQRASDTLYADDAGDQQAPAEAQDQANQEGEAGEDQSNEGEQKSETLGAPESYNLKEIDGMEIADDVVEAFSDVAKELDLSQEAAEKVLSKMTPVLQQRTANMLAEVRQQWADDTIGDKEIGGDNLEANLGVAKKALDAFGTPELRALLNESGLGNHPEVIRMMVRAGKAISEDSYVGASQGAGAAKQSPKDFNGMASALYSNQQN